MLLDRLKQVEQAILDGRRYVHQQRDLIARLDGEGRDSQSAVVLLRTLEASLALHFEHRDRIRAELDKSSFASRPAPQNRPAP